MQISDDAEFAVFCTCIKFWPLEYIQHISKGLFGRELEVVQREIRYREENHVNVR